jgi:hypothetical protein
MYVKVEIGYASGWDFAGFTMCISFPAGTLVTVAAAALIPRRPGSCHLPAAFWMRANWKWFASA